VPALLLLLPLRFSKFSQSAAITSFQLSAKAVFGWADSEPERSIVPPGQTLPNGSISLFVPQQTGTDAEGNAISGPPPSPCTLKSALSAATSLQTVGSRFTNAKRTVSWADLTAGAALTTVVEFERDQPSSPHSEASWEEDAYNDSRCCCLVM